MHSTVSGNAWQESLFAVPKIRRSIYSHSKTRVGWLQKIVECELMQASTENFCHCITGTGTQQVE